MKRHDFALEEYKALQVGLRLHQDAYFKLENYTFGGMLVVYGVLFGVTSQNPKLDIPIAAWWIVFALVGIACVRCWAHYIMVRRLANYFARIERKYYFDSAELTGFETLHGRSWIGPWLHLIINALCWLLLVGGSFALALFKTLGWKLP